MLLEGRKGKGEREGREGGRVMSQSNRRGGRSR
jgi:hypothetical protein